MEKTLAQLKREELKKLVDNVFPEIDVENLDGCQDFFSETKLIEDSVQYVNFQIGKEFYAVDISNVIEIIKVQRISYLPSAGPNILGLLNLRGNIVSAINTHRLFGLGEAINSDRSCIIIINVEKSNLGFLADAVSQVIELRKKDIDMPMVTLDMEKTGYIIGEANIDGQLVAVLDICKLVKNEIFATK